jgi:hypothetical protein
MAKAALIIPADKLDTAQSEECAAWAVEHCLHGVAGCLDEADRFVLTFNVAAEAEAFRSRWLGA